jgi:hypothetical protein
MILYLILTIPWMFGTMSVTKQAGLLSKGKNQAVSPVVALRRR